MAPATVQPRGDAGLAREGRDDFRATSVISRPGVVANYGVTATALSPTCAADGQAVAASLSPV
jgi:hypothetical protein